MIRQLSPHFAESEFTCNCGREHKVTYVDSRLIDGLEAVHAETRRRYPNAKKISVKILPGGGVRCVNHKEEFNNGDKTSQHVYGKGADIVILVDGVILAVKEMYEIVLTVLAFFEGGIGIYPSNKFIHVDVRLGKARWARIKKGKKDVYVSIEEGLKACSTK